MDPNVTLRVDRPQTVCHGVRLGAPVLPAKRVELAIGIGHADIVHVDQRQGADAGAGKGFSRPGAHATQSNDGNVSVTEVLQCPAAIESFDTAEAEMEVVTRHAASPEKSHDCNPALPAVSNQSSDIVFMG